MSFFEKYEAQSAKLANILEENSLLHRFRVDSYPMSMTIMQNQSPDAQMAMYETETDGVSSRDAKLVLTFPVGEIGVRVYGRLIISDTLLGKIKNHGKKMRDLYLQGDYATRMANERRVLNPSALDNEEELDEDQNNAFKQFFDPDDNANDEGEDCNEDE